MVSVVLAHDFFSFFEVAILSGNGILKTLGEHTSTTKRNNFLRCLHLFTEGNLYKYC